MISLHECVAVLMEEIRMAVTANPKPANTSEDDRPWELEISLPFDYMLKMVQRESTYGVDKDINLVFQCALETLSMRMQEVKVSPAKGALRQEIAQLRPRWLKGELNKDRLLRDFCQRVLVILIEQKLHPGQRKEKNRTEPDLESQRFEQLTDELCECIRNRLFEPENSHRVEVWLEPFNADNTSAGDNLQGTAKLTIRG